jgi:hypothetical protein
MSLSHNDSSWKRVSQSARVWKREFPGEVAETATLPKACWPKKRIDNNVRLVAVRNRAVRNVSAEQT